MAIKTVPIVNGTSQSISSHSGLLYGYSVRETSNVSRATIVIRNGPDTASDLNVLMYVTLSPGESTRDYFLPDGIPFTTGLYFDVQLGAIAGSVQISAA